MKLFYLATVFSILLAAASGEAAESTGSPVAVAPAPQPQAAADYHRHREMYKQSQKDVSQELTKLTAQSQSLDSEMRELGGQLRRQANSGGQITRPASISAENEAPLSWLRSFTGTVDSIVGTTLYPALSFTHKILKVSSWMGNGVAGDMAAILQFFMSVLMVITFVLTILFLRKVHSEFYQKYRGLIFKLGIIMILILPVSSFAEENEDPSLDSLLKSAHFLLNKTLVQRYILDLEPLAEKSQRYRIDSLGISGKTLPAFDSFVTGTAEYYMTMANLYEMDGQTEAVLEQLSHLAEEKLRFTNNANAERIIVGGITFLLSRGRNDIAAKILETHIKYLSSPSSILTLHGLFNGKSLSVSANLLASHSINKSKKSADLALLARVFYEGGDRTSGQNALRKALNYSRSTTEVTEILNQAISQGETDIIIQLTTHVEKVFSDASQFFKLADILRNAGRLEESRKIIEVLIEKAGRSGINLVNGDRTNKSTVLSYISNKCFELGLFDLAERSGGLLIRSLSSSERSSFKMSLPQSQQDTFDLPNPNSLAAPLYFGILYEVMDAPSKAEKLYEREISSLLERLIASNGLNIPDMLNNLSLLGRRLLEDKDYERLAILDDVMTKLENIRLANLREKQVPTVEKMKQVIDQKSEEASNLRAKIKDQAKDSSQTSAGEPARENGPGVLSIVFSGIFLALRALTLVFYIVVVFAGVIAIARRYSRRFSEQRFYAFVSKVTENIGWVYIFTLMSAPLGFVLVFSAQFAQLMFSSDGSTRPDREP
ncbi:MAG: hypothetical protein DRR42_19600 [Gammaproteobacteria bacterium]|nr:MAG: hypothetical protein DRR42_19600 [Gammaproteobacteria bacterium]